MSKKKTNAANVNFILILSIIAVMVSFALSNHMKFNKGEALLNGLDSEVTSSGEEIGKEIEKETEKETIEIFIEDASKFGIDVGNVGLDILRIVFVWIPLIHAAALLFYAGLAWGIFRPTSGRVIAYRVLMTFAYLNIIVTILVLVVGIIIHYSTFKKIKMLLFAVQCLSILIFNFYMTYSCRIKGNIFGNRNSGYDRDNQIPVLRASICTGEKVAGFKDLHTGKFQEVMLVKDDKDMQKFLTEYGVHAEDVKKEW